MTTVPTSAATSVPAAAEDAAIAAAQAPVEIAGDRTSTAADAPAVAIGADAFVVDTSTSAAPAGHLGTAPATTGIAGRPATQTAQVGIASPHGTAAGSAPSGAGSIGGALLALVLVIGLIVLLGWLAKRLPGVGGATNPALRVLGSLSLGPRERVVVIAVGETQLLVGTGAAGTRVLHTLDTPLPVPADKPTPAFAQVLAQQFGKKRP